MEYHIVHLQYGLARVVFSFLYNVWPTPASAGVPQLPHCLCGYRLVSVSVDSLLCPHPAAVAPRCRRSHCCALWVHHQNSRLIRWKQLTLSCLPLWYSTTVLNINLILLRYLLYLLLSMYCRCILFAGVGKYINPVVKKEARKAEGGPAAKKSRPEASYSLSNFSAW